MKPTVWTSRRKALGNIIPAIVWLVPASFGIATMAVTRQMLGGGLGLLIVATLIGWVTLDSFGLFENSAMRKALKELLAARGEVILDTSPFVGFASPRYHGLLDAHEDVGFLQILPTKLTFVSEVRKIEFQLEEVRRVRYRANIHTMLLLGRWVSVEGESGGKKIRLLVEPRDRPTMLGNFRESGRLHARLSRWAQNKK